MPKKWIHKVVEPHERGRLKANMRRAYGNRAFTNRGTIKVEYLNKATKRRTKKGKDTKIAKQARLALTLRKLRKKRR